MNLIIQCLNTINFKKTFKNLNIMNSLIDIIKANTNRLEHGKFYSINELSQIVSPLERANINKKSPITFKIESKQITLNLK